MKIKELHSAKKIIFLLIISILAIGSIVACTREVPPPEKPDGKIEDQEPVEGKNTVEESLKGKIKIVDESTVLPDALEWFNSFDKAVGAYAYEHPDATYIKINTKEQATGGYGIHIKEYTGAEEYTRSIVYEIIEPEKDTMVTQAITYPSVILEISSEGSAQYDVKNTKGETLPTEEKLIFAQLDAPEKNEEISSPFTVKGKIIAFEGAFSVKILDGADRVIHEEHLQADSGGPNWGNFNAEINFKVPESKEGTIEIGEYSAKDGEFLSRYKIPIQFKK